MQATRCTLDYLPHFREFSPVEGCLDNLKDWPSIFTDEVVGHFMIKAGFSHTVPHVLRICGMATQKFVADITESAKQYNIVRNNLDPTNPLEKFTMTLDDLKPALADYDERLGKAAAKPEFYV
ncbi:hypothetical protein GE061_000796 [Apolygus lucorum]|uniref:Uncharacterized protein n=1 Tax=Apolygus lucorum TaxID=248454 RepID=A0A8S9Y6I7_APOLU|nr:hypothetical protein GE061_000796 [Apolygus lucorum]